MFECTSYSNKSYKNNSIYSSNIFIENKKLSRKLFSNIIFLHRSSKKGNKNGKHIVYLLVKLLKPFQTQHFSNRMKMLREKLVYAQAAVRGFYFYKSIWTPIECEVLSCEYEENDPYDIFAIKTCQENGRILGHFTDGNIENY